jgi:hypothetical protein
MSCIVDLLNRDALDLGLLVSRSWTLAIQDEASSAILSISFVVTIGNRLKYVSGRAWKYSGWRSFRQLCMKGILSGSPCDEVLAEGTWGRLSSCVHFSTFRMKMLR